MPQSEPDPAAQSRQLPGTRALLQSRAVVSSSSRRLHKAERRDSLRTSRSSLPAIIEWGLIVAGFGVLFFLLPHALFGDDFVRLHDIEQLRHGHITNGRYSLIMPIFSAPFLALHKITQPTAWWAVRFNVIVVLAGVIAVFRLLRDRVDASLLRKVVLILLFASLFTNRLRDYYGEVFTATLVAVGIAALAAGRRRFGGWAAIVVGVANTPITVVPLALVAGAEAARAKRLRRFLLVLAAIALIMAENWIRRGGPFSTGYAGDHGDRTFMPYSGRPGFSYPFVLGVLSILFSFGRGLVFYMPGLLLLLERRTWRLLRGFRYALILQLLFVAGLVLAYAKWWAWYGGLNWGPRFFLFVAVPASLVIAVRLQRAGESTLADIVTLVVLALSAWIGVMGGISDRSAFSPQCSGANYSQGVLCWDVPEFSSLWRPFVHFPQITQSTTAFALFCGLVFTYLATPLVVSLVGAARNTRVPASWVEGWRF
jgi:hypothetical protein